MILIRYTKLIYSCDVTSVSQVSHDPSEIMLIWCSRNISYHCV